MKNINVDVKDNKKEDFAWEYEGYILSQYEINLLLKGEDIKIQDRSDNIILIRLEKEYDNEKEVMTLRKAISQSTLSHIWSKDEKNRLYSGYKVRVEDFYNAKKCRFFVGYAKWDSYRREIIVEEKSK